VENDRISDKELLVARSNKKCKEIYQRMKNRTEVPAEKLKLSKIPEKL